MVLKVKESNRLCNANRCEEDEKWKWTEMCTARGSWINEKESLSSKMRKIDEFTDLSQDFVVERKEK